MLTDDKLMGIGWNAIKRFIQDWRKEPYRWSYEAEIQAEIYRRLNSKYERIRENKFRGNYKTDKNFIVEELKNNQILNRVTCEPSLIYDNKYYVPDLLIWKKEGDPSQNNMCKD